MITYKELFKKIHEYENQFNALKGAIADEYKAFFMYSTAIVHCKNEIIKKEFFQHAQEEHEHALLFADILKELGGGYVIYDISDIGWKGNCKFIPPYENTLQLIKDNITAENCAIDSYTELLEKYNWSDEHSRIINSIINDEKEHIEDLKKLRKKVEKEMEENDEHYGNTISSVY